MRWRFVPQVFIYAVGRDHLLALALPWFGALVLAVYVLRTLRERGYDPYTAILLGTALLSSAPIFVSTGWLSFNDAWVALGAMALAFSRGRAVVIISCAICPFIDERFIFAIPGALLIRYYPFTEVRWAGIALRMMAAIAPFLICRAIGLALGRGGPSEFLLSTVKSSTSYLWVAPLALWMAFRFAYIPAIQRAQSEFSPHRAAVIVLICASLAPVVVGFTLASDTMRTASILFPLCLWGMLGPTLIERKWALWLALGNLVVPAAHVTATKIVPINSALIELWRLLRS